MLDKIKFNDYVLRRVMILMQNLTTENQYIIEYCPSRKLYSLKISGQGEGALVRFKEGYVYVIDQGPLDYDLDKDLLTYESAVIELESMIIGSETLRDLLQ